MGVEKRMWGVCSGGWLSLKGIRLGVAEDAGGRIRTAARRGRGGAGSIGALPGSRLQHGDGGVDVAWVWRMGEGGED